MKTKERANIKGKNDGGVKGYGRGRDKKMMDEKKETWKKGKGNRDRGRDKNYLY